DRGSIRELIHEEMLGGICGCGLCRCEGSHIWLKGMIGEMGISQGCVKIHCDSQSDMHLANHKVYHESTKHIDIWLHFVRDMIETKQIIVEKVALEENPTNMFPKSLPRAKFKHCLDLINFVEE
ncbi:putative copia-type protein, partial [Trifolium pratense]